MSTTVAIIWWVMLLATVLVIVPILLLLLTRAVQAARSIERYTAEALTGGIGIAGNTQHIPALKDTIGVATQLLAGAEAIEHHTGAVRMALTPQPAASGEGN
ncbi:MAG: hypothetical protein ACRD1H_05440 [Vicinamibacterales bacterium]